MATNLRWAGTWSELQDAALRRAWLVERLSSGVIAKAMRKTRNAVMGRVRRLGIHRKHQVRRPYDPAARWRAAA